MELHSLKYRRSSIILGLRFQKSQTPRQEIHILSVQGVRIEEEMNAAQPSEQF